MDFSDQQKALEERLNWARALQQTSSPQGQMVGRVYVPPSITQHLATGLKQFAGAREAGTVQNEREKLSVERQKSIADALRQFGEMSQGRPADVLPDEQAGPVRPAQAPDMNAAYQALLGSPEQSLRQVGMQGIVSMPELQARRDEKLGEMDFKRAEREAMGAQRMEQMQQQHAMRMQMLEQQNVSRQQMADEQRAFQKEMLKLKEGVGGGGASPYFQPVQTANGVMAFDARTGKMAPIAGSDGAPVIGAPADPGLQGQLAESKAAGAAAGKSRVDAMSELPKVVAQGEQSISLVDDLLKSPGFGQAVGASRLLGMQNIPGTKARDFDVRLEQIKGQQFLQAFESLKGGGQITEAEGKKATDAISRMNASSSEGEFIKSAREFQEVIRTGVNRARTRAGVDQPGAISQNQQGSRRMRFDAQGNPI